MAVSLETISRLVEDKIADDKVWQDKVNEHFEKLNGTVGRHEDTLFCPKVPSEGAVNRIRKLEKNFWKIVIAITVLSISTGAAGSQWVEEVMRNTPITIPQSIIKFFMG